MERTSETKGKTVKINDHKLERFVSVYSKTMDDDSEGKCLKWLIRLRATYTANLFQNTLKVIICKAKSQQMG